MTHVRDIVEVFEKNADPAAVEGMARFGIRGGRVYGLSIPFLRGMAREIGRNHRLALDLHKQGSREARILAYMIAEPCESGGDLMESWAATFDTWEVCDQCCMNLFEKMPSAWVKAVEWSDRPEEFVKRAGFVLMARLAVSDKKAADDRFIPFLGLIAKQSTDTRAMVKKAVNWALRQIGKRNTPLNELSCATARDIGDFDSAPARWIAADALRELESEAVQIRFAARKKRTSVTS